MRINEIKFVPKANAFADVYSKATGMPFVGEMMAAAAGNGGKDEYITYTLEDAFGSCDDESRCYDGKTITFNRPEGWEDTFFVAYKIMEKYYYDEDTRKVEARTFEDMEEMEWINSEDSPMYDLFPYVQEEQDIPDETENEWLVMAQITDDNVTITDKWTINVDNRTEYPYCGQCTTQNEEL